MSHIPKAEYARRRKALMAQMVPNSIAILPAAAVAIRNRDVEHVYRQDSDFQYLSGFPEPEAVIFAGRVPHTQVERYYSLIDVLAYPRKAQRLTDLVTPLKPLEAMAQRRLVAASSVGGHRELIEDGVTGTLFAPDDPAACAAALARLLGEQAGWDAMRMRALDHVRTRHDWAENARRYLSVYHLLLAHGGHDGAGRAVAGTG